MASVVRTTRRIHRSLYPKTNSSNCLLFKEAVTAVCLWAIRPRLTLFQWWFYLLVHVTISSDLTNVHISKRAEMKFWKWKKYLWFVLTISSSWTVLLIWNTIIFVGFFTKTESLTILVRSRHRLAFIHFDWPHNLHMLCIPFVSLFKHYLYLNSENC